MAQQIQLRRGTAAAWTAANPTLAIGEVGYETDTAKLKVGNGTTAWSGLAYFGGGYTLPVATASVLGGVKQGAGVTIAGDGTLAANVTSVAGRTGAVTLSAADVSGLASSATTDTTNASNISSGTLNAARLPSSAATVGKAAALAIVFGG